jgi:hypothetical protein
VGSRAGLDDVKKRNSCSPPPDSNSDPSAVQPVASRYTDYAISTICIKPKAWVSVGPRILKQARWLVFGRCPDPYRTRHRESSLTGEFFVVSINPSRKCRASNSNQAMTASFHILSNSLFTYPTIRRHRV